MPQTRRKRQNFLLPHRPQCPAAPQQQPPRPRQSPEIRRQSPPPRRIGQGTAAPHHGKIQHAVPGRNRGKYLPAAGLRRHNARRPVQRRPAARRSRFCRKCFAFSINPPFPAPGAGILCLFFFAARPPANAAAASRSRGVDNPTFGRRFPAVDAPVFPPPPPILFQPLRRRYSLPAVSTSARMGAMSRAVYCASSIVFPFVPNSNSRSPSPQAKV